MTSWCCVKLNLKGALCEILVTLCQTSLGFLSAADFIDHRGREHC